MKRTDCNSRGRNRRYGPTAALSIALAAISISGWGWQVFAGESQSSLLTNPPAPLDGRVFTAWIVRGDLSEDDQENRQIGDELLFAEGMFSSAICRNYNFSEAPYWVRLVGDQIHFLVELTSPTDGRMIWQGVIEGDTLEGTMRWTKERWYWTIDTEHKIRGSLKTTDHNADSAQN